MIDRAWLKKFAETHKKGFLALWNIEQQLKTDFHDMALPARAIILSALSGEPLMLLGPPGTGKSLLIRRLCAHLGIEVDKEGSDDESYFEYLLTPFTEPGELFGFWKVENLRSGKELERHDKNTMQKARIVYLDEVFNGSSAILNSLLTFINEGRFHDRGKRIKVPLEVLLGATNQVPNEPQLRAIYDRYLLRCAVNNVEPEVEAVHQLLSRGASLSDRSAEIELKSPWLLEYLKELRAAFDAKLKTGAMGGDYTDFTRRLTAIAHSARSWGLSEVSNRRLVKMYRVMVLHRIYCIAASTNKQEPQDLCGDDLALFPRYFLDHYDDPPTVARLVAQASAPFD